MRIGQVPLGSEASAPAGGRRNFVGSLVADGPNPIEQVPHPGGEKPLIAEDLEPLELLGGHLRDVELGEGLLDECRSKPSALDHRSARIGVDQCHRHGSVHDEQLLVRQQAADVRRAVGASARTFGPEPIVDAGTAPLDRRGLGERRWSPQLSMVTTRDRPVLRVSS